MEKEVKEWRELLLFLTGKEAEKAKKLARFISLSILFCTDGAKDIAEVRKRAKELI